MAEEDAQTVRTWGERPEFGFPPKDAVDLGSPSGWIDMARGARLSGSRFAYRIGDVALPAGFSQASVSAWYATRSLWICPLPAGHPYRLAAAGTSVAEPTWSANGQRLLYVRRNGLWLTGPRGGHPARIVASLFRGAWPNYYYYVDWRDQFAWSSPH